MDLPTGPRTRDAGMLLPVGMLTDEQLIKFLEKNRRRHVLYGQKLMRVSVQADKVQRHEGQIILAHADPIWRTPNLFMSESDLVVNRIDGHVIVQELRMWLGPVLRRMLVKLKTRKDRYAKRTLLPALTAVEVLPKHPGEVPDPKLDYTQATSFGALLGGPPVSNG